MASLHSGKRNSAYVFAPVCVSRLVSSFGLPEHVPGIKLETSVPGNLHVVIKTSAS